MSTIKITNNNFEEEVLNSNKTVLVDFWASWCGPCRMLGPTIEEISNEHPEIKVGKVNVDEESELATNFQIMSIPSLIIFKNGKAKVKAVGVRPKEEILDLIKNA